MYWQSFEQFVAYYDASRTNLLIDHGVEQMTLGELYPGAFGKTETLNITVKLKKLSVRQAHGSVSDYVAKSRG